MKVPNINVRIAKCILAALVASLLLFCNACAAWSIKSLFSTKGTPTEKGKTIDEIFAEANAQTYSNDDWYSLNSSMWIFLDGENDNFSFFVSITAMYQSFNDYSYEVHFTRSKSGLHLTNIYRGIYDANSGKYVQTEMQAVIYKNADSCAVFRWLRIARGTNDRVVAVGEPIDLMLYKQDYSRTIAIKTDKYDETFISYGFGG